MTYVGENTTMDNATMDHAEVTAHRVVDRYLLGKLDPQEAQRFERHYLACEACLAELETTEQLVDSLRDAAAEDVARTVGTAVGVDAAMRRARRGQIGRLAIYAALAVLALVPSSLLYNRLVATDAELATVDAELGSARAELAASRAPQAALAVLPLNALRGQGDTRNVEPPRRIRLGDVPGWVILALELDRPAHARYRVTLHDAAGAELWRGDDLTADESDTLTLTIHSTSLVDGEHHVEVTGLDENGALIPLARFSFLVVAD